VLLLPGTKVKVLVPDMSCQMCVHAMKKNFKSAVDNVKKDVQVDLDSKIVTLNLKEKISDEDIQKRVKKAGYKATKISWLD
jgi:copper chaperone CopZ